MSINLIYKRCDSWGKATFCHWMNVRYWYFCLNSNVFRLCKVVSMCVVIIYLLRSLIPCTADWIVISDKFAVVSCFVCTIICSIVACHFPKPIATVVVLMYHLQKHEGVKASEPPQFPHSLFSIVPLCHARYTVTVETSEQFTNSVTCEMLLYLLALIFSKIFYSWRRDSKSVS